MRCEAVPARSVRQFSQPHARACSTRSERCSAPCVGRIDEDSYAELVEDAKAFLAGKSTDVQARLGKAMAEAAEAKDFELAAVYRDRLRALTYIQGSQTVHAEGLGDGDIFALAAKAGQVSIQAFFIRGGQNWGHRAFFPAHTADVRGRVLLTSSSILRGLPRGPAPPSTASFRSECCKMLSASARQ